MKGIIALLSLMLFSVVSSATTHAPPGNDLPMPIVSIALHPVPLDIVNELQACRVEFVVQIDNAGRDVILYQVHQSLTPLPFCLSNVKDARDAVTNLEDLLTSTPFISYGNIMPGIAARDCLTCKSDSWPSPKLPDRPLKFPPFNMEFRNIDLPPPPTLG